MDLRRKLEQRTLLVTRGAENSTAIPEQLRGEAPKFSEDTRVVA